MWFPGKSVKCWTGGDDVAEAGLPWGTQRHCSGRRNRRDSPESASGSVGVSDRWTVSATEALGFKTMSSCQRWMRKKLLGESASRRRGRDTSGPHGDMPASLVSDPRRGCLGKVMDINKTCQWKEMEHFSAFWKPDFLSKLMGTRACWVLQVLPSALRQ